MLNTDTSPQNFWTTLLDNDLTEKFKKSAVASAMAIPLPLCFSYFVPLRRFRENLTKPFYFYLSCTCDSPGGTPSVISLALSLIVDPPWRRRQSPRGSRREHIVSGDVINRGDNNIVLHVNHAENIVWGPIFKFARALETFEWSSRTKRKIGILEFVRHGVRTASRIRLACSIAKSLFSLTSQSTA